MVYMVSMRRKRASGISSVNLANKALAASQRVRNELMVERKWLDVSFQNVVISSIGTPNRFVLSAIDTGTGAETRIGRTILPVSNYLTGNLYFNSGTQNGAATVRLLVIRDMGTNGVAPTASQVFNDSTVGPMTTLNVDYFGNRFEVITSVRVELSTGGRQCHVVDEYRKLGDVYASFGPNTVAETKCISGHYFLLCASEVMNSLGAVIFDGSNRLFYVDS